VVVPAQEQSGPWARDHAFESSSLQQEGTVQTYLQVVGRAPRRTRFKALIHRGGDCGFEGIQRGTACWGHQA